MIRQMKRGEEDEVRALLARLSYEDQTFWRKQTEPLEDYLAKSRRIPMREKIKGRNVIFVAEEDGRIVGLCWCAIVDRGVDKQVEVAFAWTHHGNEPAVKLYEKAGFKEVDQLVMAFVPSNKNKA